MASDSHAVSWGQYIANYLSNRIRMVAYPVHNITVRVAERHQCSASAVSIKVIRRVSFHPARVPDLVILPVLDYSRHKGIHLRVRILQIRPQDFSVVRVVSSCICLFVSVVQNRDSGPGHRPGDSVLEPIDLVIPIQEPRIIMIIHEISLYINILESRGSLAHESPSVIEGTSALEQVLYQIVQGVVQGGVHVSLVGCVVRNASVEFLAYGENARGLGVLRPEGHGHLRTGIDSEAIDAVFLHDLRDPGEQAVADEGH